MTAPTSVKGYVDPYALGSAQYASLYLDILEHVPDLTFPLSIPIYARMRRDPKLQAVLQGWTLNLRRAQWQIDPAGCRPEVVALCADATGLNVAGADRPSAARLHGVSWNDHLNAALRMLTFGFAGFEMQADTSTGRAKLSGLWERPQWTIHHIHIDGKTGLLTGVTQDSSWKADVPQIKADNLVWYVNEREGAAWAGSSLLRSCYASWLIKEELRRVHAIACRRWSAGVPVMEALPGTSPTPAQMSEAMQMAAAARGGEQAGASTPPGFTLRIAGIEGALPDTLGFMSWLDQQMTGSALMGALDLGQTPNGSRALGDTFMDSFLLALESTAEAVADVATRQICARVVGWNYGTDEPVPRVVASGVGSRREVTAESLNLLLGAGALGADPALEAWVRREYRLPERDKDAPFEVKAPKGQFMTVPGTGGDGTPTGAPTDVPLPAKPATVKAAQGDAGQPVEPDYQQLEQQHAQAVGDMTQQWQDQSQPLVDALVAATAAEVAAGTLVGLGMLAVKPAVVGALAGGIAAGMLGVATASAVTAAGELAAAGVSVAKGLPQDSRNTIRDQAEATAGLIANGYASAAAREALRQAGPDVDADTVASAVRQVLEDLTTAKDSGLVAGTVAAAATTAQAEGRRVVLAQLPAGTTFKASEHMDGNACPACKANDGHTYQSLADALADYPTGKLRSCAGKDRCRGTLIPVLPK